MQRTRTSQKGKEEWYWLTSVWGMVHVRVVASQVAHCFLLLLFIKIYIEALRAATLGWQARGWRAQAAAYCKNALVTTNLPPYQSASIHHLLGRLHAFPGKADVAQENIALARSFLKRYEAKFCQKQ